MATDFTMQFRELHGRIPSVERLAHLIGDVRSKMADLVIAEVALKEEQELLSIYNTSLKLDHQEKIK